MFTKTYKTSHYSSECECLHTHMKKKVTSRRREVGIQKQLNINNSLNLT